MMIHVLDYDLGYPLYCYKDLGSRNECPNTMHASPYRLSRVFESMYYFNLL